MAVPGASWIQVGEVGARILSANIPTYPGHPRDWLLARLSPRKYAPTRRPAELRRRGDRQQADRTMPTWPGWSATGLAATPGSSPSTSCAPSRRWRLKRPRSGPHSGRAHGPGTQDSRLTASGIRESNGIPRTRHRYPDATCCAAEPRHPASSELAAAPRRRRPLAGRP